MTVRSETIKESGLARDFLTHCGVPFEESFELMRRLDSLLPEIREKYAERKRAQAGR